jgi:hypothetical protein
MVHPWILKVIRKYSLHTLPQMVDQIPADVHREYGCWYGGLFKFYHREFDTLLWIPWQDSQGNGGSVLMATYDNYEIYHFRQEDGDVWKNIGRWQEDTVATIQHIYGPKN